MKNQTQKQELLIFLAKVKQAVSRNQSCLILKQRKYRFLPIIEILQSAGFVQSFESRGP